MKVTETVVRECCQFKDLKPIAGTPKRHHEPEWMFCVYCGARHRQHGFMDAAGSRDYEYRKEPEPWTLPAPPEDPR